jgi:hypothetical protein
MAEVKQALQEIKAAGAFGWGLHKVISGVSFLFLFLLLSLNLLFLAAGWPLLLLLLILVVIAFSGITVVGLIWLIHWLVVLGVTACSSIIAGLSWLVHQLLRLRASRRLARQQPQKLEEPLAQKVHNRLRP